MGVSLNLIPHQKSRAFTCLVFGSYWTGKPQRMMGNEMKEGENRHTMMMMVVMIIIACAKRNCHKRVSKLWMKKDEWLF